MKTFLIGLLLSLSTGVFATPSPFQPHVYDRFVAVEARVTAAEADVVAIEGNRKLYAATSESIVGAAAATIAFDGISLPAGSIITNAYLRLGADVVTANDNTLAIGCDASDDLLSATDLTGTAGDFVAGDITGAAATYIKLAAACEPEGTIGAGASGITAGTVELYIEYIPGV